MGLFRRSKHAARTSRKPTLRERRAAERTARAEASLVETEQRSTRSPTRSAAT